MRAINTIPQEEYAERLFEAMRRMNKRISGLEFEEDLRYTKACDEGNEEKVLKHWFNREALYWASQAIVIAPGKLEERIAEINRREFAPTNNEAKAIKPKLSDVYYICERCGCYIKKPTLFNPEVVPAVKINGKFYCNNCTEYDEETGAFKVKKELMNQDVIKNY